MAGLFDTLRRAVGAKGSTAADLERALAEAVEVHRKAEERVASLEAVRRRPETLAAEGGLERMRLSLQGARDELDDASAYVAELGRRHAEALAGEAAAARLERYRHAQASLAKAAKAFPGAYTKAAAALVEVIRNTAEVDALVMAANRDLPPSAEPLPTVEGVVRDIPTRPQHTKAPTERDVWAFVGMDQIVPPAAQERVEKTGDRTGVVTIGVTRHKVERRRVREIVTVDQVLGESGARVTGLTLPGLKAGDQPFYEPPGFNAVEPGSPAAVLATLDALAEPQAPRPDPPAPFERASYTILPRPPEEREREAA